MCGDALARTRRCVNVLARTRYSVAPAACAPTARSVEADLPVRLYVHHDPALTESTCHFISELDAQADLDVARPVGGAVRLTERAGAQLSVEEAELRVIEQVQDVGPELESV